MYISLGILSYFVYDFGEVFCKNDQEKSFPDLNKRINNKIIVITIIIIIIPILS